jgi:hypothetical protein
VRLPPDGLASPFEAAPLRQRSEQWRTASQSRFHALRQVNGSPQVTQIFCGKSAFLRIFGIGLFLC